MKRISSLLLSLWVLLPTSLSAQLVRHTSILPALRYSDYATIEIKNSFKKLNDLTDIVAINPDGKYFVVATQKKFSDYITYTIHESESGEVIKTEKSKSALNYIFIGDKMLTLTNDKGLAMTDLNTMTLRWNHRMFKDKPFYIHGDILLAIDRDNEDHIYGLDISKCSSSWAASIPHRGGIRTIRELDEENLLIVADQLVKLNTRTGAMQSLKIKNYITNGKKIAGNILLGALAITADFALLAATGYVVIPIGSEGQGRVNGFLSPVHPESTTIAQLSSNLLRVDSIFYFADRNNVYCFDTDLNIQWSTPLPPKYGSRSFLHLQGDTLWMVNYGMGIKNSTQVGSTGVPFFAAFDAHSGSQLMLQEMGKKDDPLHSVVNNTHHVSYLFTDSCKTFYFDTHETVINAGKNRFKDCRLTEDLYCLNAETHQFDLLDSCLVYAHDTKKGDIYQISGTDTLTHLYTPGCVYHTKGQFADSLQVIFHKQENETFDCWVIDAQGKPALHVEEPVERLTVTNDFLFFIHNQDNFSILHKDVLQPAPAPQSKPDALPEPLEAQPEPQEAQLPDTVPNS
ncbi:MAG: hypothetical protein J6X31_01960 [Bacteroidales bacterium]|nr:hypothetical protein [Bacteroidales bacterium]